MIAYKGTDSKMMCRGFQFEIGKEYRVSTAPVCCENGFHACTTLAQTFTYYPPVNGSRYFRVEVSGDIDHSGYKLCTNGIRIIEEVFVTEKDCLEAVKQDGMAIRFLTNEQRSPEVCLEAVKQDVFAIFCLTNEQHKIVRREMKGDGK